NTKMNDIRKKVGLVFQYPEHQLFEETVEKDVAYGPLNLGLSKIEVVDRVKGALNTVNLNYNEVKDKSPFELSGGQMRRVAIAGVLAMKPDVLILDEPTAGLDPQGRDEILTQIKKMHERDKNTVILVSHSMEDIAKYTDNIIVMSKGRIQLFDIPENIFKEAELMENIGLSVPQISQLMCKLNKIDPLVKENIYRFDEAKYEILEFLRRRKNA
ncbi:MAG: ATP-binding cassette domain-containing protein, partial [Eubacteriales bacterium]